MKKSVMALAAALALIISGCNSRINSEAENSSYHVEALENGSGINWENPLQDTSASVEESKEASVTDTSDLLSGSMAEGTEGISEVGQSEAAESANVEKTETSTETEPKATYATEGEEVKEPVTLSEPYTRDTKISQVINDPVFGKYGRLIFPVNTGYYSGDTLGELGLTWYNNIDPDKTVEIVNYMHSRAESGQVIFYDIYSDSEKAADSRKNDTGLFFFKGTPGEKFAVCSAGGGFAYVGAMHDSFPHALELSKHGYNAFAIIYRPGAQTACEDLSRAISFIFEHADELEVDTDCYSLWGGSAGARMSAWVGSDGTEGFGERALPHAGAVIMQYTGLSEYSENDPPTYVCVGDSDGIASWRVMKDRLDNMSRLGIDTEFHVYEGLRHGFGIGTGTVAEGWVEDAVRFWERQFD